MTNITIINGPNLNMLGEREPSIYGSGSLAEIKTICEKKAGMLGVEIDFKQSNHEGEIISWIQEASHNADALIINPAGFGHTSIAIMDTLLAIKIPAIEVHLSNIYKREEFRHNTYSSRAVKGVITGLGAFGYILAMEALCLK